VARALSPAAEERFEIRQRLGSGSFGSVYAAFDRLRQREVALKVLDRAAPESVARFKREFRSLAELRHPNLAAMYELLVLGEQWILTLELVHGSELLEALAFAELQSALVAARTFDPEKRIHIRKKPKSEGLSPVYVEHVRDTFRQLAVAIEMLHSNGVIHRDIKPSNIMITAEGRVVLLDFGLVAEMSLEDTIDRAKVVGTPGFMSPEQIEALPPTPASDWYSFGVMLYLAITGLLPFTGDTDAPAELIENQMRGEVIPLNRVLPNVPEDLASLAEELVQRDPGKRPKDAEILQRLGITLFDPRRPDRQRPRIAEIVARGRELRRLRALIANAEPGVPQLIHLDGSPGVGKSVVADALLDGLRSTDAIIVGGRCRAWESVPMNAIDAIVDSLARLLRHDPTPAALESLSRSAALTQLFPALATVKFAPGDDTIAIATGDKLVARAAAELTSVLLAAAGERPLVIFLDDAQWGDYQSAQMFARLLRSSEPQRVTVIFCFRTEDARTSLLLQGLSTVKAARVRVGDLSRAATGKILKRAGLRRGGLLDRVYRESRGNPTLTDMIIHEDGAQLGRVVSERLNGLSAAAQRLFVFLLSSEGPVSEEEAQSTLELFEVDEPLRTLVREHLIRIRRTGDLREIDLYHPRMREVLRRG